MDLDDLRDAAEVGVNDRDPSVRLQRAWLLLTIGERDSSSAVLVRAADEFYEVTVRNHDWPYAWLGLGLTKLELDAHGFRETVSPHQPAGSGWLTGALSAFEEALRREPGSGRAIAGVAEVLLREPIGANARRASSLLRGFAERYPLDAPGALALARVEAADGHWQRARALLGRYGESGGDPGVLAWELAVVAFGEGRAEEGRTRYAEAATGGPAAARLVRENLALIATPAELIEFDRHSGPELIPFLQQFWSSREIADGRPCGSRLIEHFRRIRYARTHFATGATMPQFTFEQVYRGAPRGLDDRGPIYIRHGEPDARATYVGGMEVPPNESWSYFRPQGPLILHFASLGPGGFRLLESLSALHGDLAAVYESRAGLGTEFLALAGRLELEAARRRLRLEDPNLVPAETWERERRRTREMIRVGTTTDSDPIDLERSWAPVAQIFGTDDPADVRGGLLVAIALPAPHALIPTPLPGGAAGYVLRVRTTAADDSGRVTLDADSVLRVHTPRPLAEGEYLNLVLHYPVTAGNQRVRVIVADSAGARGGVRILSGVPVADFAGAGPAMSDLIVGREGSPVVWRRPSGQLIPLHPLNAWSQQDQLTLAFDLGGLAPGQAYRVRLGIADIGADSTTPPKASVEFEHQASGGWEFVSQSLGLRTLRPGRYLLTATVRIGDTLLRRERRITVLLAR